MRLKYEREKKSELCKLLTRRQSVNSAHDCELEMKMCENQPKINLPSLNFCQAAGNFFLLSWRDWKGIISAVQTRPKKAFWRYSFYSVSDLQKFFHQAS
jgi:hypothetical protein